MLAFYRGTVIFACRNKKKSLPVIQEIKRQTNNEKVEFMELDLASLDSVRNFVTQFRSKYQHLNILINNAGIMP